MSEKKELNGEQLKKVYGGSNDAPESIVDRRDEVSGPIEETKNSISQKNDTFYGPAE